MFTDSSGDIAGGFTSEMPKNAGQMYLPTDNIEQSLAAVKAAGGKTTKVGTPISDEIGAWAQFEDPDGRDGLFEAAR